MTLGSFIRLSASFIAMQFYYASHSVICFASFVANKITLKPQVLIKLLLKAIITLCRMAEYHLNCSKNERHTYSPPKTKVQQKKLSHLEEFFLFTAVSVCFSGR